MAWCFLFPRQILGLRATLIQKWPLQIGWPLRLLSLSQLNLGHASYLGQRGLVSPIFLLLNTVSFCNSALKTLSFLWLAQVLWLLSDKARVELRLSHFSSVFHFVMQFSEAPVSLWSPPAVFRLSTKLMWHERWWQVWDCG